MLDVVYLAVTAAFFLLMIGYVAACARLGGSTPHGERRERGT